MQVLSGTYKDSQEKIEVFVAIIENFYVLFMQTHIIYLNIIGG